MIKNAQDIKESSRQIIVSTINEFVNLKQTGAVYKGLCPFHDEKTPSFTVFPKTGTYKCFGCQQGGDAIQFLMDHQGMSYPEAIVHLAGRTGHVVEYVNGSNREQIIEQSKKEAEKKKELSRELEGFLQLYYEAGQIPTDINGRKYSQEIIKKFGLVCTPNRNLIKEASAELGLRKKGENNYWEPFRNRLLFPIHDHRGQLCGLAGRILAKESKYPKYINSQDSLLFQKGRLLYGLNLAIRSIGQEDQAILVEGYTDVLALHDNGINNAVATCGTAFTQDQAKLIGRFTKNVLIIRDGDNAGRRAAEKDVETAVMAGLHPRVALLPEGEDPDSMIRKHKKRGWEAFLAEESQDGIIWRIMLAWDKKDPFKQEQAFQLAGSILSQLGSDLLRSQYVKQLCKPTNMGSVKKMIYAAIKKAANDQLERKFKLTPAQQQDILKYGLYEHNNCYYVAHSVDGKGIKISNFIIKPIMLIKAKEASQRILQIVNENKKSFTQEFDSTDVYDINSFGKIVEGWGNFLFNENAKPQHFAKIKRKIYSSTPTSYPVFTLGQHREGFYTWGNGISHQGKFIGVDEFGLVTFNDTKFYLPAFSQIKTEVKSDDDENHFEDEKLFSFYPSKEKTDFTDWTEKMQTVHLKNGMMGVNWYLCALFRDLLYHKFQFFPHMFHFGPTSAGKSFMARSLAAMFGKPRQGFHLMQGSDVGFYLRLEQARNSIAWFEEYSNDVSFKRVEALKGAYDGSGHEKANRNNFKRTSKRKVNSACLITGQQQPTQDIALFKRCITLNFPPRNRTSEQNQIADDLVKIQQSGQLSGITIELLKYRDHIAERFEPEFDAIRSIFKASLHRKDMETEDRLLYNHLIPVTMMGVLKEKVQYAWDFEQFAEFSLENLIRQTNAIYQEDELSIWWRIIQYLIDKPIPDVRHGYDIQVEERGEEKFLDESSKKDTQLIKWDHDRKLLYLRFTTAHQMYLERHQRTRNKRGLDLEALQYYLRNSDAFLGRKKAKKFKNGKAYSAWVFDMDRLPLELPLSVEVNF